MNETTFVYAALASWRGVEGAPKQAAKGSLKYDQTSLYDERRSEFVAWPVGKGKARVIAIREGAGQRYGSWGRSSGNVADYVRQAVDPKIDGPVLMLPYTAESTTNSATPDWVRVVETLARNNAMAEAYALAAAIRMPVSKIPRPVYSFAMETSYRYHRARSQEAIDGLDPVKVAAKRAMIRKENKYAQARQLYERGITRLVERDPDYIAATSVASRGHDATPEAIAAYLGLPADTYIKFVGTGGTGSAQNRHQYSVPELAGATPTTYVEPSICRRGYHFTDIQNWYGWSSGGETVYAVEPVTGIAGRQHDKYVAGSIRFLKCLGYVKEIERAAKVQSQLRTWDPRYGDEAWGARDAVIKEYREFYPGPSRASFGLV